MGAKFCKILRCSENKGKPCEVADDCPMFKWDIERQLGKKPKEGEKDAKRLERKSKFDL
jgi:hypothetical protein